jgi:hypothetical protein
MYAITAQVLTYDTDEHAVMWRGSWQIPTFYLDESVQGITDERHAVRIARQVIDPLSVLNLIVSAVKVS